MVIIGIDIVFSRVVRDYEQDLCRGSHRVALCEPDVVLDGGFLKFETRTGLDLRQEAFNPDGMDHVRLHLDPLEGFRVNPETALHPGEHLGVSIRRPVSLARSSTQEIDLVATELVLTLQVEVECLRELA